MNRILFTLAVGGLVASISGLSLWRAKTLVERELGVLTPQVDAMASEWEARKVPLGSRVVTFLLSDARGAFDPFLLKREEPSGAGDWIGANLIGGEPASRTETALVRAFADSTALVAWTHDGFAKVSREAMTRELANAVIKAHDAGAEINIVALGSDAGPVLEAMKRLRGQERGGQKVGASKIVILGGGTARERPENVLELAQVWTTREVGSGILIRVLGGKRDGETLNLEELWPGLGDGADNVAKSLRLVRAFLESPRSLDEQLGERQALRLAEREKKASAAEASSRAAADEAARLAAEAAARAAAAARKAARTSPVAPREEAPEKKKPAATWADIPQGWGTASLLDYEFPKDQDTGWVFSAPEENLEDLSANRRGASLRILKAPGVIDSCEQGLQISAFPAKDLGPGDRDAAIHALFEKYGGAVYQERRAGATIRRTVHGRPAVAFEGVGPDGSGTSYFVVDTGRDLIYLARRYYKSGASISARCTDGYRDAFERISKSIRPKKGS
ncbi:MAG: hypothetical protein HYX59_15455 [Elusimicrobia bacterium]|nr:hypothetical protein [Elusimicrobiota bacterium]